MQRKDTQSERIQQQENKLMQRMDTQSERIQQQENRLMQRLGSCNAWTHNQMMIYSFY